MKYLKTLGFSAFILKIAVWLVISNAITIFATDQVQTDTPRFDHLKSQFEQEKIFFARFSHEYNDTFTGEQQLTDGSIWVGKERYKMSSGNNLMVVDNEVSRLYDHSKNRVIISDYIEEEDDFAPSRMLQGVDETFTVSETELQDGRTLILLSSEDPFSIFTQVSITLDVNGIPLTIEAIDQVGNQLITRFNQGIFINEEIEIFEFTYPEDAEFIDLRHDI